MESLLGRMMRVHMLEATPVLYARAPLRWSLIIILVILVAIILRL